ncbi:MAG TPA: hypothetical protein VI341_02085, partial [Actinomycetota bacterium]
RPIEDVGSPTPLASPSPMSAEVGLDVGPLSVGRHPLITEGVPFSFSVPTSGWENHGNVYLSKSVVGPQGADAIIYWTSISDGDHAESCGQWWGSPVGSISDFAAAVATPGTKVISGPSDVTVDGRVAKRVVFTVREDVGCNPGFHYTWEEGKLDGAFWAETDVGDTIRVWLVKLGREFLYIEGDTHDNTGPDLAHEILQIVRSIRFRVGYLGIPPASATPSAAEGGELVLSFFGGAEGVPRSKVFVYADGRLIWQRDAALPGGPSMGTTGFLEQRLTPEGVELLRSEVTSSGLFGDESDLAARGPLDATPGSALERLVPRLTDPGSWLPANAWDDREIRAYVPSRYEICYRGPAQLSAQILSRPPIGRGLLLADPDGCSGVGTAEARALFVDLKDADLKRSEPGNGPAHQLELGAGSFSIWFEPILPHGEIAPQEPG